MVQKILYATNKYSELDEYFKQNNIDSILLVCGESLKYLRINEYFKKLPELKGISVTKFSNYQPNPKYESVLEGVRIFKDSNAKCIVAIGGGSAIDVAKCIKLYCSSEGDGIEGSYLKTDIVQNDVSLLAIPTTAGSGSEATRFAVVYYEGVKQSVTDDSIIPRTVLFDSDFLTTLPIYQKKSTVLDALCHAVESFWSINSTDESKEYSRKAIRLIAENIDDYIAGDKGKNSVLQEAAFLAGKAINITQTTAGHAMCYGLTSRYNISHGHAAALCVCELWPWMIGNIKDVFCADSRGTVYLKSVFKELAECFGEDEPKDGYIKFRYIIDSLELPNPVGNDGDIDALTNVVNPTRLGNNPIRLSREDIEKLYRNIVKV